MNRPAVVLSGIGVIVLVALSPWRTAGGQAAPLAAKTQVQPSIVDEVWAMEDSYWRYVKAADVEKYLTLWNKDFRGWPCDDEHPATKANIGDWVRDIRDKKSASLRRSRRRARRASAEWWWSTTGRR